MSPHDPYEQLLVHKFPTAHSLIEVRAMPADRRGKSLCNRTGVIMPSGNHLIAKCGAGEFALSTNDMLSRCGC
jgi:hypothetical protein